MFPAYRTGVAASRAGYIERQPDDADLVDDELTAELQP